MTRRNPHGELLTQHQELILGIGVMTVFTIVVLLVAGLVLGMPKKFALAGFVCLAGVGVVAAFAVRWVVGWAAALVFVLVGSLVVAEAKKVRLKKAVAAAGETA